MLALELGCALALWLILSLPRRELRSPALALLRSLWPAWRFYEEIADAPALDHRVRVDALGGEPGPWQRTLRPPRRTAAMLVWNPSGNLHLAYQSLIEHLASELAEREESGHEAQPSDLAACEHGGLAADAGEAPRGQPLAASEPACAAASGLGRRAELPPVTSEPRCAARGLDREAGRLRTASEPGSRAPGRYAAMHPPLTQACAAPGLQPEAERRPASCGLRGGHAESTQPMAACASYRLVRALVALRVRSEAPLHYQFRLIDAGGSAFESDWHALESG